MPIVGVVHLDDARRADRHRLRPTTPQPNDLDLDLAIAREPVRRHAPALPVRPCLHMGGVPHVVRRLDLRIAPSPSIDVAAQVSEPQVGQVIRAAARPRDHVIQGRRPRIWIAQPAIHPLAADLTRVPIPRDQPGHRQP
jgi:hypothetical protein